MENENFVSYITGQADFACYIERKEEKGGNSKRMSWIKWHHAGVPDEEGEEREEEREILANLSHCKKCTALSGCYFMWNNKPTYPQHIYCDCLLLPVSVSYDSLTAYCDIRKLTEYIFRYDNSRGKNYLFEDWGYNIGDAENLKEELERQAKEKYLSGDYRLQFANEYGQRITITIVLQDREKHDIMIKTGWLVHPLGRITCATPFSGVVK